MVWLTIGKAILYFSFYEHLQLHSPFLVKLCLGFNLDILGRHLEAFKVIMTPIECATLEMDRNDLLLNS